MSIFRFRPGFAPIMGFIGMNGAGKTAMAVDTVIEQARISGAPIYSTTEITTDGIDCREITSLSDVLKIERGHVLFDEIASVAPARGTQDQPPAHVLRLASLRHYDATLTWTAPVMEDVDVVIRRVTQYVVSMKPLMVKREPGQLWPNTRLSYGTTYDIRSVESVVVNTETPKGSRGFVRIAGLPLGVYDTRAEVEMAADHTLCLTCHKPRRREYCNGRHEQKSTDPGHLAPTPVLLNV